MSVLGVGRGRSAREKERRRREGSGKAGSAVGQSEFERRLKGRRRLIVRFFFLIKYVNCF